MFVIVGNRASMHCFTRCVGIGSSGHDLDGEAMIILRTAAASTGTKLANEYGQDSGILTDRAGNKSVCSSALSFCIFPAKCSLKASASLRGESCFGRSSFVAVKHSVHYLE